MRYYDIHYAYTVSTPTQTYREHGLLTLRAKTEVNARKNAEKYLRDNLTQRQYATLHIYMVNVSLFA